MTADLQDLLYRILAAVDYSGNRAAFINDFLEIIAVEAIGQLAHLIHEDDLLQLKSLLNDPAFNPGNVRLLLGAKVGSQVVNQTFSAVAQKDLQDYLNILLPTLSAGQKARPSEIFPPSS